MDAEMYEMLVTKETRTVQQYGTMTLPKDWRDEHGISEGQEVVVEENEDGQLVVTAPPDANA